MFHLSQLETCRLLSAHVLQDPVSAGVWCCVNVLLYTTLKHLYSGVDKAC